MDWLVYIVKCSDGTLYTGVTNDMERRLVAHNSGKGARYTSSRRPVQLLYTEEAADRAEAQRREYSIKKMSRVQKFSLVESLSDCHR